MDRQNTLNLKKRYLIWLYKTTKEALDKIERQVTQLEIDKFILEELEKLNENRKLDKSLDEFKVYIQKKEEDGQDLKYEGNNLKPDYHFLTLKLEVIEKTIIKELGEDVLKEIKFLYEEEMIERIFKSTEYR